MLSSTKTYLLLLIATSVADFFVSVQIFFLCQAQSWAFFKREDQNICKHQTKAESCAKGHRSLSNFRLSAIQLVIYAMSSDQTTCFTYEGGWEGLLSDEAKICFFQENKHLNSASERGKLVRFLGELGFLYLLHSKYLL